jgi:cytosine deaminase
VIGENKSYQGSEKLLRENGVEVSVVNNSECIEMMADFINNHSGLWNEDIGVL